MNKNLIEIDELHKQIEKYFVHTEPKTKTELEIIDQEFLENNSEILKIYNKAIDMLREVTPTLTPEEVIEGYKEGSILLHMGLSGFMVNPGHFHEKYLPIMIEAIQEDKSPVIYKFLVYLSQNLSKDEILPLVLKGLESHNPRMRDSALGIVRREKLFETIPKVRILVNDPEHLVADYAKKVLEYLEENG